MRDSPSWGLKGFLLKWFTWKTWLHPILGRLASFSEVWIGNTLFHQAYLGHQRPKVRADAFLIGDWLDFYGFVRSWGTESAAETSGWGCGRVSGMQATTVEDGRGISGLAGHNLWFCVQRLHLPYPSLCWPQSGWNLTRKAWRTDTPSSNLWGGAKWERLPFAGLFSPQRYWDVIDK